MCSARPLRMRRPQFENYPKQGTDARWWPSVVSVMLTELPKSGGIWLGQLPTFLTSMSTVVFRDGQDELASLHHHAYFCKESRTHPMTKRFAPCAARQIGSGLDNLSRFIEQCFTNPTFPKPSWAELDSQWKGQNSLRFVHYENLRRVPTTSLDRARDGLDQEIEPNGDTSQTIKRCSFVMRTGGRSPVDAKPDLFLSKSIVRDWMSCFLLKAREAAQCSGCNALEAPGHKVNAVWVTECAA
jgi:hypothetical protein